MNFNDYFERVFVINLAYKPDRRERLARHMRDLHIAKDVTWVRACSGDMMPHPAWWNAGNGAWGCLLSHARIVQDAIMDGLESFVVLEDDAVFQDRSRLMLKTFMEQVPDDWGQLYLGGQHLREPTPVDGAPFVLKCWNVNRTHAFALRKNTFVPFHQHILHAPDYISKPGGWHIDHQLGIAHERTDWNVYAPLWWIAGQDADWSNISGRQNPRLWWHASAHSKRLPFLRLPAGDFQPSLEEASTFHAGNTLKPGSMEDVGLDAAVEDDDKLRQWLSMIAREAVDQHRLPAWQHPAISAERVAHLWKPGAREYHSVTAQSLLSYPWNELFPDAAEGYRTEIRPGAVSAAA